MHSQNRWLVLAIVSSALFLIVIDMTVLYTALPRLTHDLNASASQKLWIVNAYPLVVAGLLPGLGTLGDRVGHKQMFLIGLGIFGLASLWAAFSPTPSSLIASRVALAIGAAAMMPATLSLIRLNFIDDKERSFAIGVWAAVASGGAAFGPVVGGVLLEFFWWGSVFLINVPVVLVALVAGYRLLVSRPSNRLRNWDLPSSVQIMVGLVGLTFAIKELAKRDPSAVSACISVVLGVIGLVLFSRRQRQLSEPLIDFDLFKNPVFSAGVLAALAASAALISVELILSQRLQLVQDYSPLQAALRIMPIPLAAFVTGPIIGNNLERFGVRRVLWLSLAVSGVGVLAFWLSYGASSLYWITALLVMGAGIGAAIAAASSAIMMSAPEEHSGMAASVEEVSYELGGSLGIAVLGSLMGFIYSRTIRFPEGILLPTSAYDSLDEALLYSERMVANHGQQVITAARSAFDTSFSIAIVFVIVLLVIAAIATFLMSKKSNSLERLH